MQVRVFGAGNGIEPSSPGERKKSLVIHWEKVGGSNGKPEPVRGDTICSTKTRTR